MGKPQTLCGQHGWVHMLLVQFSLFLNTEYPHRKLKTNIKNYLSDWRNCTFKNSDSKTEHHKLFICGPMHFLVTVTMVARQFDKSDFLAQYIPWREITANHVLSYLSLFDCVDPTSLTVSLGHFFPSQHQAQCQEYIRRSDIYTGGLN